MNNKEKIAIIGMSALFPGSESLEQFWDNLINKRDLTGIASDKDFGVNPAFFFNENKGVVDRCYSLRGGYIRDFQFNPQGYSLNANYLAKLDALYQWALHVSKESLAQAKYKDLDKCGVIVGNLSFPTGSTHRILSSVYTDTLTEGLKGVLGAEDFDIASAKLPVPANNPLQGDASQLIKEALSLKGTALDLDAACASSLYAIKLACDELQNHKADMMLAGAVCASDQLFIHMGFSIFHAYARATDKFVPLDKNSAGLVSSEGAAMITLKRLSDAERDGDNILGVISGIGLSNDGKGKFLLSPNPKGQLLAFERAYQESGTTPDKTTYLECHATGTPLGDITEINSIEEYFSRFGKKPLLGSVKSNMGHLLTAAGMTGLFKVLLAIEKELIPPNINMQEPIDSEKGWLTGEQIITSLTKWEGEHKQAGINSFGFGGTNAHMIINSYVPPQNSPKQQINVTQQINNTLSYSPPLGGAGGDNLKCPLAITGMDVHFGNCTNLADFYQTIYDGKQHFRALPPKRWKGFEQNKALLEKYGFQNGLAPKGNYIEDFEIDLLRYKIQPKEAETLEPQQALILKVADNAIKDAQLKEGQNVAVIIAMQPELAIHHYLARWDSEWQLNEALEKAGIQLNEEEKEKVIALCKNLLYHREGDQTPSQHTSFVGNIMASRIAALWDFTGPAFTITNGDDSVLRALEVAQHLLSNGEVEAVVVGGVDFSGGLENVLLNQLKEAVNQSDNPSLNFNIQDKGWLIGEGAGAVVIKKSEDAAKEEKVYGVIEEMGANVKTEGAAYYELCARGFEADKHELTDLLQQSQNEVVALGSVKANIGHTFAASGIASLIKTALCLHYKFIPAIPNWESPKLELLSPPSPPKGGELTANSVLLSPPLGGAGGDNPQSPYYFPTKSFPWIKPKSTGKRKALIHNVCDTKIVMREGDSVHSPKALMLQQFAPKLFLLKGDNQADLLLQLNALEVAIEGKVQFSELAKQFWAKVKDKKQQYCIALLAENVQLLLQEIQRFKKLLPNAFAKNQLIQTPQGSYFNPNPTGHTGKLSFIYPGSATAYEGLGADVFQLFPDVFQYYEGILPSLDNFIASEYIYPRKISKNEEKPSVQTNAIAMMSVGVFFSTVYTHILREYFKVEPSATLGYSMGECSSMYYALGIWGSDNANIFQNSPIFQNRFAGNLELLAEEWQMTSEEAKARWVSLVLLTSKEKVLPLIQSKEKVYLSFINTDNELIISGDKMECYAIAKELGCINVEVPFQNVIHHDFCNKEREGLIEMHNFAIQDAPKIDFYSSIKLGKLSLVSTELAENSTEVCCRKVDFPQLIRTVFEDKVNSFVEIGANSTCTAWIKDILKSENHLAVSVDKKGVSFAQTLLSALGQIISNGFSADISGLYLDNSISVKEKTFLKKIMVGGERILEAIQKEKVSVTRVLPKRELVAVSEVIQSSVVPVEQSLSTDINISTMNENIVSTNTSAAGTIGENGLLRHDFSTGKHLEGKTIIFTQKDLEEFAEGKIANVFGEEYAIIDTYKRRVMLPMYPYLLVSRVTGLKGKRGEFKPSKMQTEYDIPYNAWFSTDGQIPWAVSVESGQCDLMLISYLGIDFQAKGEYVYRLLDCTLTFLDDLPFEGQTLRYDISINSFVRNGNNLLFFFSYECFVQDRMVLKMDGGCAGFFTDGQLSEGNGVVYTNSELEALKNVEKKTFTPLLETKKRTFTKDDLRHLIKGDMHLCFEDESYFANGRNPSLRLPDEQILMIDEIVSVDLQGGAYGLGEIIAEKNLSPTDWFFPCHFRDDEVLAGSLQAEGGGNLLRFFMLMLGLQRLTKDARYQPIFDLPQKVRCRKQVIPSQDTKLIYKLVIKEIGLTPNPYVIGDLEIISNGIITVHFENLGLQLREKTDAKYLNKRSAFEPSPKSEGALLNEAQISTFALGRLSDAFGEDFKVYDHRKVSRQPNTDLQLISRVLKIEGTRGSFAKPSTIYAEYDVPQDAWYYTQNASRTMPYSVLMEIALQPCGLMGAYLGSTLRFPDQNLYFRNLDGEGEFFDLPEGTDFGGQTIHNKSVLLSSVALGGVILQKYTFELSINGRIFYRGNSSFGFFPKESLAQQAGLDNGAEIAPWYETQQLTPKDYFQFKLDSVYAKMKLFKAAPNKPHFRLSDDQFQLLDNGLIVKEGGNFGKGYIYATKFIRKYDWFFTCHFYQDPVMPGSLGVEAILEAMQIFAIQQNLAASFQNPRFQQVENNKTLWKYRGQILLHVKEMHLEVHFKSIEMRGNMLVLIADTFLWNEGMRIYQVTDLALGICEG